MSRVKLLLAVMTGVLSAFFWVVPAQAHNSLTGSTPKNGARVTEAPETVTLSFLAKLDPTATEVTVTGPDGAAATAGEPGVKANKVSIGVVPGAAGVYTVAYAVVSVDGHPVKGRIRFTVTSGATAGATPAAGSAPSGAATATAPTTAAPTATATAPTATATAPTATALEPVARQDDGTPWWPWLLGTVALLLAAAAATFLVRRRRS